MANVSTIFGVDEIRTPQGNLMGSLGFGASPDWELIERKEVLTAVATVDIFFDATDYDELEFHCIGMVPATDGAGGRIRCSNDGSTFDSGATTYAYSGRRFGQSADARYGSSGASWIDVEGGFDTSGNASGEHSNYRMRVSGLASGDNTVVDLLTTFSANFTGGSQSAVGGGVYLNTSALQGLQFLFDTGNVSGGVVIVRGRRKVGSAFTSQDDWVVIHDDVDVAAAATHDYFWDDQVYDEIEITLTGIKSTTDIRDLQMRFSSDGSTFHSGATDYRYATVNHNSVGGSSFSNDSDGAAQCVVAFVCGDGAEEVVDSIIHLTGVSNTTRKQKGRWEADGIINANSYQRFAGSFIDTNTNDSTVGFQLRGESSSTFAFDRVRVRGRRLAPVGAPIQRWVEKTVQTTDATVTDIAKVQVPNNTSVAVRGFGTGTQASSSNTFTFNFIVAAKNNGGTTALSGAAVIDKLDGDGGASWNFTVTADDTEDTIDLEVTGAAATTIDWRIQYETISEDNT